MKGRPIVFRHVGKDVPGTWLFFGNAIEWPDGKTPMSITKVWVETENGKIFSLDPERISFADIKRPDATADSSGPTATLNNPKGGPCDPTDRSI